MIVALTACGKKQSVGQPGLLVQVSAEKQSELKAAYPNAQVVNPNTNLFLIKDASESEVEEKLPDAKITEDKVIQYLEDSTDEVEKEVSQFVKDVGCSSMEGKDALKTNFYEIEKNENIEIGNTLNFEVNSPYELNVMHMDGLGEIAKNFSRVSLHFPLERIGAQTFLVLVKNKLNGSCSAVQFSPIVTINEKYAKGENIEAKYDPTTFYQAQWIHADKSWGATLGNGVKVAVLDTGVDYNHPEINEAILINENEIPNNWIDDDSNGVVDDVAGYDFSNHDAFPQDDNVHGTHVAGIIAAKSFGIAREAKILPVKVLDGAGRGTYSAIIKGILYAVKMKVDIINMSLGGEGEVPQAIQDALDVARLEGILVVVAAGNESNNMDVVSSHFHNGHGANILAVAANDESGALTEYSNYGLKVDISAPGGTSEKAMMSLSPRALGYEYIGLSGTSMAAPVVTGVAALVKAIDSDISGESIKWLLINSGTKSTKLEGKIANPVVIDAWGAVEAALASK